VASAPTVLPDIGPIQIMGGHGFQHIIEDGLHSIMAVGHMRPVTVAGIGFLVMNGLLPG